MNDRDETAWEDINPTTALAPRPEPVSPSLGTLKPATNTQFRNELTACLALVAPVGMTEEAKRDWLTVAWGTLKHLPEDLLRRGCAEARKSCDHPSKLVPTIIAATQESFEDRAKMARERLPALPSPPVKKHVLDRRGEPMSEEDTAELNRCLENMGATARYRPDGSKYSIADAA